MDGLLVDSEPLWRLAQIEVFQAIGVPLTNLMCGQTMGLRIDEVATYWRQRYPWSGPSDQEVANRVVDQLLSLIPLKPLRMALFKLAESVDQDFPAQTQDPKLLDDWIALFFFFLGAPRGP